MSPLVVHSGLALLSIMLALKRQYKPTKKKCLRFCLVTSRNLTLTRFNSILFFNSGLLGKKAVPNIDGAKEAVMAQGFVKEVNIKIFFQCSLLNIPKNTASHQSIKIMNCQLSLDFYRYSTTTCHSTSFLINCWNILTHWKMSNTYEQIYYIVMFFYEFCACVCCRELRAQQKLL